MKRLLLMLITSLLLTACATVDDSTHSQYKSVDQTVLFNKGEKALLSRRYAKAIEYLEALDAHYPYGQHAEFAHLDSIYAYYKKGDLALSAAAADHFIHLNPRSKYVDYAYYMRAVAHFEMDHGAIVRHLPVDESQRDLGSANEAYIQFKELVKRHPP